MDWFWDRVYTGRIPQKIPWEHRKIPWENPMGKSHGKSWFGVPNNTKPVTLVFCPVIDLLILGVLETNPSRSSDIYRPVGEVWSEDFSEVS